MEHADAGGMTAEDVARHRLLPPRNPELWKLYKEALGNFWTVDEVVLADDRMHWARLEEGERRFVRVVLAFFAGADGQVADNLAQRFLRMPWIPNEAACFYAFQTAVENIHAEMYQLLLLEYTDDASDRDALFNGALLIPSINAKATWIKEWTEEDAAVPDAERLLAFACVEGIFFSSSFCSIFWLKKRGLMPGLTQSNEYISRDEGLHTKFAVALLAHRHAKRIGPRRLELGPVNRIVDRAVQLETAFVREALPLDLVGMRADDMAAYVRYTADVLLGMLGYPPLYDAENPFEWMALSAFGSKNNFFERKNTNYPEGGIGAVGEYSEDF